MFFFVILTKAGGMFAPLTLYFYYSRFIIHTSQSPVYTLYERRSHSNYTHTYTQNIEARDLRVAIAVSTHTISFEKHINKYKSHKVGFLIILLNSSRFNVSLNICKTPSQLFIIKTIYAKHTVMIGKFCFILVYKLDPDIF